MPVTEAVPLDDSDALVLADPLTVSVGLGLGLGLPFNDKVALALTEPL